MKVKQPFEIPHEGSELERAARRKIDDLIEKLECMAQSLRGTRNESCSTSALPNEVLARIFIFLRNMSIKPWTEDVQISWIRVGQVCHHWREVALRCPSLWSAPFFARPDLAREMIQRSKAASLTIKANAAPTATKVFEQVQCAMAQIHRIKSINLLLFRVEQSIFSSLLQPAPLLEEISLCDVDPLVEGTQLSFPPDALSRAPRLRRIDLDHLNFSWESAVFKHRDLTDLRLDNNCGTSTFSQMMNSLYHLPNLRILMLTNSIPSHTTSDGSERILDFKFLERLELTAEAVDCTLFLRLIQYPPGVMVMVHSFSAGVEDSVIIFSIISQYSRRIQIGVGAGSTPVIIRSAQLVADGVCKPRIGFFDVVEGYHEPSIEFRPIIMILLDGDQTLGRAHSHLLTSLYHYFDLSSLEALTLNWRMIFDDSEIHVIQNTLGKLQKLRTIKVSDELFFWICRAIAENTENVPAGGSEKTQTLGPSQRKPQHFFPPVTVFPALELLSFVFVDFRQSPEIMDHLTDMLMKRSEMNAPIDRLHLDLCRGVGPRQKRQLGELVVYLESRGKAIDMRELNFDTSDGEYDTPADGDEDESSGFEGYSAGSTPNY